jgi:phage portal protein BeeE
VLAWWPWSRRARGVDFSGAAVFTTTYGSPDQESIVPPGGWAQVEWAYKNNSIVFAAILARLMLFSEATFKFQTLRDKRLFGGTPQDPGALLRLESPWPNATTGELLARMEQDTSLAGNAYVWNAGAQLVRLRPDWVTIVSEIRYDPIGRTYREPVGYWWDPGPGGDYDQKPQMFGADEVAHWSPIPDPCANFRGMSWLSPIVREITADNAMTDYKIRYLENAATPNIMIRYPQRLNPETVDRIRDRIQARYGGVENAFKTIVLDEGADFTVVGNTFEQMNFTSVQAAGENRILMAAGVPGIVVGSKEGLEAATYSNYGQAMRRFADLTMRPQWRSVCASLQKLVTVPPGTRLWYDVSDIAALRQGEKERAETMLIKSQAAGELVKAGFDLESIKAALESSDMNQLKAATAQPLALPPGLTGNGSAPVSELVSAGG